MRTHRIDPLSSPLLSWSTPTLIMSDLHLGRGELDLPIIERILVATGVKGRGVQVVDSDQSIISQPPQPVERVVFVGDLFDFNLGYQDTLFRAHLPFFFCLEQLRNSGIEVIVFTGNHDPDPSPILSEDLEIMILSHPTSVNIYGRLTLLEHGDLLEPSWKKRMLCQMVRHPWTRAISRLIPPALIWRLTQYINHPQEFNPDAQIPLESVIQSKWPILQSQGYQHWLFGHFHQALAWYSAPSITVSTTSDTNSSHKFSNDPSVFVLGEQNRLNTCLYWDEKGPLLSTAVLQDSPQDSSQTLPQDSPQTLHRNPLSRMVNNPLSHHSISLSLYPLH